MNFIQTNKKKFSNAVKIDNIKFKFSLLQCHLTAPGSLWSAGIPCRVYSHLTSSIPGTGSSSTTTLNWTEHLWVLGHIRYKVLTSLVTQKCVFYRRLNPACRIASPTIRLWIHIWSQLCMWTSQGHISSALHPALIGHLGISRQSYWSVDIQYQVLIWIRVTFWIGVLFWELTADGVTA